MDLDLKRLHQVMVIVRTGSISRAAEELHLTQPALSRSISALEEKYNVRIFDRGRGGASLTASGKLIVAEAEPLLRQARSVEHNFRLYSCGEAGRMAFGMGPLIASLLLPTLSLHFLQTRPNLHLRSVVKSATVMYQDLLEDHIEIFFCVEKQVASPPDITYEWVGEIDIALMVRAAHPLAQHEHIERSELAAYPVLTGAETSMMNQVGSTGSFVCDNYHILRDIMLQSDAVWVSSPQLVSSELSSGLLRALRIAGNPVAAPLPVYMISREANKLTPIATAIRDYVKHYLSALTVTPPPETDAE
jgi:DNA-binding transcriptional LysR family regulator